MFRLCWCSLGHSSKYRYFGGLATTSRCVRSADFVPTDGKRLFNLRIQEPIKSGLIWRRRCQREVDHQGNTENHPQNLGLDIEKVSYYIGQVRGILYGLVCTSPTTPWLTHKYQFCGGKSGIVIGAQTTPICLASK